MRGALRKQETWVILAFLLFVLISGAPTWLRLFVPPPLEIVGPLVPEQERLRRGDPVRLHAMVCNHSGDTLAYLAVYALRTVTTAATGLEDVIVLEQRPTPVGPGCSLRYLVLDYPAGHTPPGRYQVFGVATFRSTIRDWDLPFESLPFEIYADREGT